MQVYIWGRNNKNNGKKRIKIPQKVTFPVPINSVCFSKLKMLILSSIGDVYEYKSDNNIQKIPELSNIVKIKAGDYHYTALDKNNQLWTWGTGDNGCLGIGSIQQQTEPIKVAEDVVDVFCGPANTFILTNSNQLYACGDNCYGQLGIGSNNFDDQFKKVQLNAIVTKVASDLTHTLFLTSQGEIFVAGRNKSKCLGLESTGQKINIPIKLSLKDRFVSIACGGYSIAINQKGSILIWGNCPSGLITSPTIIDKINKKFVDVNSSNMNSYALSQDGQLWVWGDNKNGELGVGDMQQRWKPFPVVLLDQTHVHQIFVGMNSALCLAQQKGNLSQTFKRTCCSKRRTSYQQKQKSIVNRSLSRSRSVHSRSKSKNQTRTKNRSKQIKIKQPSFISVESKPLAPKTLKPLNHFSITNKCPIKVIDDYCSSQLQDNLQGSYSSIPHYLQLSKQKPQTASKHDHTKLQQILLQNRQLRQIIQQKDTIIQDITNKIQVLQQAIQQRDSRDQLTLRQHIVQQVNRMQGRYIGQINKLSQVIQKLGSNNNNRQLKQINLNKQNIVLNISSKQIKTQQSNIRYVPTVLKTKINPNDRQNTQQHQTSTIYHNDQNDNSTNYQTDILLNNRIKQLENKIISITQTFQFQLQNSTRQIDMYKHKVKQLTKSIAEKNQIIQQLKIESLGSTCKVIENQNIKDDGGRKNQHMDKVINSIERNRRRISESADKLINILEST